MFAERGFADGLRDKEEPRRLTRLASLIMQMGKGHILSCVKVPNTNMDFALYLPGSVILFPRPGDIFPFMLDRSAIDYTIESLHSDRRNL
jgi:hypothetical protein